MRLIFIISLSVLISVCNVAFGATYSARVWKSTDENPSPKDFPEMNLLNKKPNTAIAFTGGGARSYLASMGYLAALTELDLMKNVRYIGGISGGAWATLTYTYVQNTPDDKQFLGPIVNPENLSPENVQEMDTHCARSFTKKAMSAIAVAAYVGDKVDSAAAAWAYGVSQVYLEPAGILPQKPFSWNRDSVNEIVGRNKGLNGNDFTIPVNANRPFPIVGTALVGPVEGAPYDEKNHNYTMLEITPLYVGQFKNLDVEYSYSHGLKHTRKVGGAVEPFAFAVHGSSPFIGMAEGHTTALLNVPAPSQAIDLQFAGCASSYAVGSFFESLPAILNNLGMHVDYWSPAEVLPSAKDTFFADGGSYQNIPLISFIQRRVEKIVLFFNSVMPLQPADKWNVYTDEPTTDQITDDLSCFFGVFPKLAGWEDRSYEYTRNQIFSKDDWYRVVTGMQQAQAAGNGIFVTFDLTTIENTWWGVPAGLTFHITFVYLGRIPAWEKKLTPEMYDLLVPKENVDDLSHGVEQGTYKNFPHYGTTAGDIDSDRANVLADLTGWSLMQHADMFRQILQ